MPAKEESAQRAWAELSRFIAALKKANIALDRKVLADLATNDPKAFSTVLAEVRG